MSDPQTKRFITKQMCASVLPWIMWFFGALFYFYEFLIQVSPNVMGTELMKDFMVTANRLGILSGVYFYAYAFMQIPAGVLLDRLGPQKLLALASALLSLSCLLFSYCSSFEMALVSRFSMGIGSAFAIIGCMKITTNWFPLTRFGLLIGLTVSVGMSGAIMGEAPLAEFMETYSWRDIMAFLGVCGSILCFTFLAIVRDYPKSFNPIHKNSETPLTLKHVIAGLKQVITSPQSWVIALYGLLMFAPTITFCGLWGAPFLREKYGISDKEAASLVSLIFVGWLIGSPLCGWISDRIKKRLPTMIAGSIGALICILIIIYGNKIDLFLLGGLLTCFGVFSSGFLTSFSIIRERSSESSSASALGFMNMMNTLGIAITQPLVGIILDLVWGGTILNGLPHYSLSEYQIALAVLPMTLLIAIFVLPFIQETHCKSRGE